MVMPWPQYLTEKLKPTHKQAHQLTGCANRKERGKKNIEQTGSKQFGGGDVALQARRKPIKGEKRGGNLVRVENYINPRPRKKGGKGRFSALLFWVS